MNRSAIVFSMFLLGGCVEISGGGGNTTGGPPTDALCSSSHPCPSGQFCYNGVCAVGCNSDGDCASNQYCDTAFDRLCHNKTVTTCPDTPCASGQVCIKGLCSTPPPDTMCTPRFDANDGCQANAICLPESESSNKCYTFPYCPQDGKCPVGTEGAVCNDGYLPGKARICLTGACHSAANCPANWKCVKLDANDVLGNCSSGNQHDFCAVDADCRAGLTCQMNFCEMLGSKGAGQPCQNTAECMSGLECRPPAQGFPSQCTAPGSAGAYCELDAHCVPPLTCEEPVPGFPKQCM